MKTFLIRLSSSVLVLGLPLAVWAKPVAIVMEVSGTVIKVTKEGRSSSLKANEHLEEMTELLLEEGASVKINDYYDTSYSLAGGSQLKIFDKTVQLKKGKTWVQSTNTRHPLALTTANGLVSFNKSEFIASYEQATSRSQVLVMNGTVDVANILNKNMKYSVEAGNFTMIDPDKESGLPRVPTRVGESSLNAAIAEFKAFPSVEKETKVAPARAIASVPEAVAPKKGEIIFISSVSKRAPASVASLGTPKKQPKKSTQASNVPIRFYGFAYAEPEEVVIERTPASVSSLNSLIEAKAQEPIMKKSTEFDGTLKTHPVTDPKYSKELQNLIDDLKKF